ncbi:MAG: hypothetical protein EBQ88_08025 [Betaproteobacteria bacterium]|nr:hypothetical protein [Betaproteobacteria bacterium]NBX96641.1 hypothetical protein [Betaproteobacteria bacterium]
MSAREEIAAAAATWIVEHGLDYGAACRKAAEHLGVAGQRGLQLPDHLEIEDAVREHLGLFFADTQPAALRALRELAAQWMRRLRVFDPHVGGAVWRGTATEHSPILLDLYTDDPTGPELALLNQGVTFEVGQRSGRGREPVPVIGLQVPCRALGAVVPLEISVWSPEDLKGALKPDARGLRWRGTLSGLEQLLNPTAPP